MHVPVSLLWLRKPNCQEVTQQAGVCCGQEILPLALGAREPNGQPKAALLHLPGPALAHGGSQASTGVVIQDRGRKTSLNGSASEPVGRIGVAYQMYCILMFTL